MKEKERKEETRKEGRKKREGRRKRREEAKRSNLIKLILRWYSKRERTSALSGSY